VCMSPPIQMWSICVMLRYCWFQRLHSITNKWISVEHWQMNWQCMAPGRREKLVPLPVCPPQMPHSLSRGTETTSNILLCYILYHIYIDLVPWYKCLKRVFYQSKVTITKQVEWQWKGENMYISHLYAQHAKNVF
jgi:hypothetical protein